MEEGWEEMEEGWDDLIHHLHHHYHYFCRHHLGHHDYDQDSPDAELAGRGTSHCKGSSAETSAEATAGWH